MHSCVLENRGEGKDVICATWNQRWWDIPAEGIGECLGGLDDSVGRCDSRRCDVLVFEDDRFRASFCVCVGKPTEVVAILF